MPVNIIVVYDFIRKNLSVQITDEGQGLDEQVKRRVNRILDQQDGHEEVREETDDSQSDFYRSLLICKTSVDLHFGSIQFYSNRERRGTTFEFSMRMKQNRSSTDTRELITKAAGNKNNY